MLLVSGRWNSNYMSSKVSKEAEGLRLACCRMLMSALRDDEIAEEDLLVDPGEDDAMSDESYSNSE